MSVGPIPLPYSWRGTYPHDIKNSYGRKGQKGFTFKDKKQHYIFQYTDDSSFMIRGDKRDVDEMIMILKVFSEASGMKINWEKSCVY